MLLSKAKLTLSLKRKDWYISSYMNFFTFGIVEDDKFVSFLEVQLYDFHIFYSELKKMIDFLLNDSQEKEYKHCFKCTNQSKESKDITWQEKTVNKEKIIILIKDNNKLVFNSFLIENLLKTLPIMFLSSSPLSFAQKFFINYLTYKQKSFLQILKGNFSEMSLIFDEIKAMFPKEDLFDLYQLFLYYFEEILIISDIKKL